MLRIIIGALSLVLMGSGGVNAADYPTRAVTMVIPFAAGGPTDDFCDESFTLKIASTIVDTGNKHYLKPDLDSAVAQMARVVNDRAWREAAAVAGPERVRERYSWRAVTATLSGVLRA